MELKPSAVTTYLTRLVITVRLSEETRNPHLQAHVSERRWWVVHGVQGDTHRGFNHQEFSDLVHRVGKDNKILLTYNDSSDIREAYSGFRIDKAQWSYGMNASKKSSEVIISNF